MSRTSTSSSTTSTVGGFRRELGKAEASTGGALMNRVQAIQSPNATKSQSFQSVSRPTLGSRPQAAIGLCGRQRWYKRAELKTWPDRAAGPPAGCGRDSPVLSGEKNEPNSVAFIGFSDPGASA